MAVAVLSMAVTKRLLSLLLPRGPLLPLSSLSSLAVLARPGRRWSLSSRLRLVVSFVF
jgi:hypothetical protein